MNDKELHAHCKHWASWCYTRRYYLRPGPQTILARLQPSRSGVEPDGRNDPDMQYFNMALHALGDMREHEEAVACFNLFYVDQASNIKVEADRLGIARSTYYRRVIAFARKAYSLSISIKRVHEEGASTTAIPIVTCSVSAGHNS